MAAPPACAAATATDAAIDELAALALDPALDACCRRDAQQQLARERVRAALQRADRVESRARAAAGAVVRSADAAAAHASSQQQQQPLPDHQQQQQQQAQLPDQQQQHEPDGELAGLRAARLAALRAQAAATQEAAQEGWGRLNDVPEARLPALLAEPPGRGCLVVHLAVQGYAGCDALDEILADAAAMYKATYFARVVVRRSSSVVGQLQLPHGPPALLVTRQGALLGKAHVSQFGTGADVWEEEVLSYLRRFRVLAADSSSGGAGGAAAAARRRPGGSCSSDCDSDGEAGDADWAAPCEVCGRTYPHEHVRAIYGSTQQHGSDDDEDDR